MKTKFKFFLLFAFTIIFVSPLSSQTDGPTRYQTNVCTEEIGDNQYLGSRCYEPDPQGGCVSITSCTGAVLLP